MSFKNTLRVMKHLILLSCFCVSVSYASVNKKNTFVELTTNGIVSFVHMAFIVGGGLGYKYELDSNNYFGYVLADVNIGTSVFTAGAASDEQHILAGKLNLEYGYEFMRDSLFSFGLNVSPVMPFVSFTKYENQSDKDPDLVIPIYLKWNVNLLSSLGIFGNFNINDSFEVAIEAKATFLLLDQYVRPSDEISASFPIPFFEIKGRYYF